MNVKRGMGSTTRTFSCRYTAIREDKKTYFWDDIVGGHHTLFSIVLSALLAILATQRSLSDLFFIMLASFSMWQAQSLESLFWQCVRMYASFEHV